jgi:hypothetical protein
MLLLHSISATSWSGIILLAGFLIMYPSSFIARSSLFKLFGKVGGKRQWCSIVGNAQVKESVHLEHGYQSEGDFHPTILNRMKITKLRLAELDLEPHCSPLQSQQATMRTGRRTRCTSRGRHGSPALSSYSNLTIMSQSTLSDSSGVSMLSRSPSPPPGLSEKMETLPQSTLPKRGRNGRFLSRGAKLKASPTPSTRQVACLSCVFSANHN